MGRGRERLADMIESAVSFGVVMTNSSPRAVSGRKRESPDFLRHTAAGKRVQHALTAPQTGLTHLIRSSKEKSLSEVLEEWAQRLRADHAGNVQASGDSGGTVMQNATVAMYNGGYQTLGVKKQVPFGRDGRIWLVYHALGGPVIEEGDIAGLLTATGGHHKTGEYKMSEEKLAQREHDRILEQLTKVIPRALELEAKWAEKAQTFDLAAVDTVNELVRRFEEKQRKKNGGDTARTAENREEGGVQPTPKRRRPPQPKPANAAKAQAAPMKTAAPKPARAAAPKPAATAQARAPRRKRSS